MIKATLQTSMSNSMSDNSSPLELAVFCSAPGWAEAELGEGPLRLCPSLQRSLWRAEAAVGVGVDLLLPLPCLC